MPKNGPARVPRKAWFLDSNISARSPKKAIFLHIVVIFLHGLPKKVFCAQLKRTSLNLQCITSFCFLYHDIRDHLSPLFPLTVLRVTVPDQYFCTKHPNLNITAREFFFAVMPLPAKVEIFTSESVIAKLLF